MFLDLKISQQLQQLCICHFLNINSSDLLTQPALTCCMSDVMCIPSAGPPKATGLHLPPYSLQRGLQAGGSPVLPLPPHQQKTRGSLMETSSPAPSLVLQDESVHFLIEIELIFHSAGFEFQTAKFEPFHKCEIKDF